MKLSRKILATAAVALATALGTAAPAPAQEGGHHERPTTAEILGG